MAGLSLGVVVVEAALKSGSLITARLAVDMGREVFAIPGSIHSPLARGPHALIQQGAKLVESGADILTELHPAAGRPQSVSSVAQASFARSSQALRSPTWDAIGYDPITEDQLQRRTGLPPAQLQVELFALELEGHIARRGHGQFVRTRA